MHKDDMSFTLGWELEATTWKGRVGDGCAGEHYDSQDEVISCEDAECENEAQPIPPIGVDYHTDGSVNDGGHEFVLAEDVVSDIPKGLSLLKRITELVEVDKSCGFHVHVGLSKRTKYKQVWAAWMVQLAREIENESFEAVPKSRRENTYCLPWSRHTGSVTNKSYEPHKYNNHDRYHWINVVEIFRPGGIGTVENRLLGNTRRYSYCLAWISFTHEMARGAWQLVKDPSLLPDISSQLKFTLACIKDVFINNEGNTYQLAYKLARKQGLMPAVEDHHPLLDLACVEEQLRLEAAMSERRKKEIERNELKRLLYQEAEEVITHEMATMSFDRDHEDHHYDWFIYSERIILDNIKNMHDVMVERYVMHHMVQPTLVGTY